MLDGLGTIRTIPCYMHCESVRQVDLAHIEIFALVLYTGVLFVLYMHLECVQKVEWAHIEIFALVLYTSPLFVLLRTILRGFGLWSCWTRWPDAQKFLEGHDFTEKVLISTTKTLEVALTSHPGNYGYNQACGRHGRLGGNRCHSKVGAFPRLPHAPISCLCRTRRGEWTLRQVSGLALTRRTFARTLVAAWLPVTSASRRFMMRDVKRRVQLERQVSHVTSSAISLSLCRASSGSLYTVVLCTPRTLGARSQAPCSNCYEAEAVQSQPLWL